MAVLAFIVAGCEDKRVSALEQRIKQLEDRVQQLQQLEVELEKEQVKKADQDSLRRSKLESCAADVNSEFENSLKRNGTQTGKGSYDVPVPVLEQMQRQKQSKIDECRLLYAK